MRHGYGKILCFNKDFEEVLQMRKPWRKVILLSIISISIYILSRTAQSYPHLVESLYSRSIYPVWAQVTSCITGILPVSLSEVLLLIGLPAGIVLSIMRLVRHKTSWQCVVSRWLTAVLTLYLLFQAGWGFNYSRLPYADIAGLEVQPVEVYKVEQLVRKLAEDANSLKQQLSPDGNAFVLEESQHQVMRKVNAAYDNASGTRPWLKGHYGTPKLAVLSTPLAYLNIAGIFSPLTMNAHVNAHEADCLLAATAMHEAAHLRGFAREDEANYIAYIVCMESDDVYVRYSGTLLALIYAGNALASADKALYSEVYATYSTGVIADLRAYNANWKPYEGKAAEVHEQVNDAYLKSNHQTDGVKSYGRMVDLLIAQMDQEAADTKE